MIIIDNLNNLTPIPLIKLNDIEVPIDGLNIKLNNFCKKNFYKNENCQEHYKTLSSQINNNTIIKQCPSGFCSVGFSLNETPIALTGIISFPRLGGTNEAIRAKQYPEIKLTEKYLQSVIEFFKQLEINSLSLEKEIIENQSMALHEIRKLNRTIKQTAERLYNNNKNQELLSIQKASGLMSAQFDIIDILANEAQAKLPLDTKVEVYRLFDKCVHIFQVPNKNIILSSSPNYFPKVLASDKTFSLISTVLIGNAIKYSLPDTDIEIRIEPINHECMISVSNISKVDISQLNTSIFKRGYRVSRDTDGSGHGLYVAQLVAKQHKTEIKLVTEKLSTGITKVTLKLSLPTIA